MLGPYFYGTLNSESLTPHPTTLEKKAIWNDMQRHNTSKK